MATVLPLNLGWMSNDAGVLVAGGRGMMRYPVPGYLVVHERGVVLFDTGLPAALITSTDSIGWLKDVFTIELTADDLVDAQLARRGVEPGAVTHVVNSHLHFDHCGRNGPFAGAATVIQSAEWDAAHHADANTYVGVPLDEVESGRIQLVDGAHDLFGDGTVVCVPTPGHTAGHQSLLVRADDQPDAATALLVGDACYLQTMLTDGVFPPFAHDVDEQRRTYAALTRYAADGCRLVFSHDLTCWDHLPAGLTG